jgi:hypothetical protein
MIVKDLWAPKHHDLRQSAVRLHKMGPISTLFPNFVPYGFLEC